MQQLTSMVLGRLRNGLLHKGLRKWAEIHQAETIREQREFERKRHIKRLQERIALRIQNAAIIASWNKWSSEVQNSRRYRALLKRAHARWTKRSITASFLCWSAVVRERKRHLIIIQRFALRIRSREAYQAFATWRAAAEENIRMRGMLEKAALKWKNAFVASALESWIEYTQARKRARFLARKIIKKMKNQNLHKGFTVWTHHTIVARMSRDDLDAENERLRAAINADKEKRKVQQLQRLLRHIQNAFLLKAWSTWTTEVKERQRLEVVSCMDSGGNEKVCVTETLFFYSRRFYAGLLRKLCTESYHRRFNCGWIWYSRELRIGSRCARQSHEYKS